jgi:ABC-type uncharacterized transport system auxiliary subunit
MKKFTKFLSLFCVAAVALMLAACGKTQAPATQAPATQAPATQAPATQAPKTQTEPAQTGKKGCKNALVPSILGVAFLLGSIVVIKRKREE